MRTIITQLKNFFGYADKPDLRSQDSLATMYTNMVHRCRTYQEIKQLEHKILSLNNISNNIIATFYQIAEARLDQINNFRKMRMQKQIAMFLEPTITDIEFEENQG